jgi:iron complex transport system substrate-binding protein
MAQAEASRIIALAPHLAELAYVAGAGDKLVGAVEYSDHPAAALALPRVGDAFQVDMERVLAMKPDLVLAWEQGTRDALISRLKELGLNVVTLPTFDIADVGSAIRTIGRLAGTAAVAEREAAAFEQTIEQQRKEYSAKSPLSVFIEVDDRPLYTVNGRQLISQVVTLCGGRNIFADLPQLAPAIGIEAVIAANPEVILSTDDSDDQATAIWTAWPHIQAVHDGNVYTLHADDIARPTTRLVSGINEVCGLLEQVREKHAH